MVELEAVPPPPPVILGKNGRKCLKGEKPAGQLSSSRSGSTTAKGFYSKRGTKFISACLQLSSSIASIVKCFWFGSKVSSSRSPSWAQFTLFFGRHIGGLIKEVHQHGGSIRGSIILRATFPLISQLWDNAHTLKLRELSPLFVHIII